MLVTLYLLVGRVWHRLDFINANNKHLQVAMYSLSSPMLMLGLNR